MNIGFFTEGQIRLLTTIRRGIVMKKSYSRAQPRFGHQRFQKNKIFWSTHIAGGVLEIKSKLYKISIICMKNNNIIHFPVPHRVLALRFCYLRPLDTGRIFSLKGYISKMDHFKNSKQYLEKFSNILKISGKF